MDPRVVQFAQNPWRTEPVLTIFWYVNFNFLLVSYYIFTLLKKKQGLNLRNLGARFMKHIWDVLWSTFSDFAVLGILRFQLKSESPFNWSINISLQRTMNLQPLFKGHYRLYGVDFILIWWINWLLSSFWGHCMGAVGISHPMNLLKYCILLCS